MRSSYGEQARISSRTPLFQACDVGSYGGAPVLVQIPGMDNLYYGLVGRVSAFLRSRSIHIPRGWIIIALAVVTWLLLGVLGFALYLLVVAWPQ